MTEILTALRLQRPPKQAFRSRTRSESTLPASSKIGIDAGKTSLMPQTFQTYRELVLLVNRPRLLSWCGDGRSRRNMQARVRA